MSDAAAVARDGQNWIGIDLGGTRTKAGVVGDDGTVRASRTIPSPTGGLPGLVSALDALIDALAQDAGIARDALSGLGLGLPGFVSGDGVSDLWPHQRELEAPDLRVRLEQALGLRVVIDNDARVVALGEARHGAGRGAGRVLVLTLGTGLGVALVVDGRLLEPTNRTHLAGHLPVRERGFGCFCGQAGCLESLVSARALVIRWRDRPGSRGSDPDPAEIIDAALASDRQALHTVDEHGQDLARGLGAYLLLYAPDVVVLGGGLGPALAPWYPAIRSRVIPSPFPGHAWELVGASLAEQSGVLGAAELIRGACSSDR